MRHSPPQSPDLAAICQRQGLRGPRPFDVGQLNLQSPVGSQCRPSGRRFALASVVVVGLASVLALGANVANALTLFGAN